MSDNMDAMARIVQRWEECDAFCDGVSWQDGATLRDVIIEFAMTTGTLEAAARPEHPRAKAARDLLSKFTVEE